jgi:hypothetical protein
MSDTLQVLLDDAERIAPHLIPSVNKLPAVVGALAKQLEQLAGGELHNLADDVLGVQPDPAAAQAGGDAQLQAELAESRKAQQALEARMNAIEAAAAPAKEEGAGEVKEISPPA